MKVNGIDARRYDAKQLTVEVQPPQTAVNYEWMTRALLPTEFETDVTMGSLKLCLYFRGRDRNRLVRTLSEFMANFTKACDLQLDGYKGIYRGYLTASDYEKKRVKNRYVLNLEFDGFFIDDEVHVIFDGVTSGTFYPTGSRRMPCTVEVYAKEELTNYVIKGFGNEDIVVETLEAGKRVSIDGMTGLVTLDGKNAFDKVSLWEFPMLTSGETTLSFSDARACVTIRYRPMWM